MPIARWFVFAGAATAVAFLVGVALIMLMIAQARELAPPSRRWPRRSTGSTSRSWCCSW
ncbi:hypothetical protein ACFSTC_05195 [Nonomuraea ferruginea]